MTHDAVDTFRIHPLILVIDLCVCVCVTTGVCREDKQRKDDLARPLVAVAVLSEAGDAQHLTTAVAAAGEPDEDDASEHVTRVSSTYSVEDVMNKVLSRIAVTKTMVSRLPSLCCCNDDK